MAGKPFKLPSSPRSGGTTDGETAAPLPKQGPPVTDDARHGHSTPHPLPPLTNDRSVFKK
jgi:hypothetical protein